MPVDKEIAVTRRVLDPSLIIISPIHGTVDPEGKNSDKKDGYYNPPTSVSSSSHVKSLDEYRTKYRKSIEDPESFWREIADQFYFEAPQPVDKPFFKHNFNIKDGPIYTKFMEGAKTNICYNALDSIIHKLDLKDKIAFYWEGNDIRDSGKVTYADLLKQVCKFSNALKTLGVKKGDRVCIYLPMILEVAVAMLACTRIGVIHSVVFAGFSAQSLSDRMMDSTCSILITADGVWRGDKLIYLKEIADQAIKISKDKGHDIKHCIVIKHLARLALNTRNPDSNESLTKKKQENHETPFDETRDKWYSNLIEFQSDICEPEWVDSEDPLFMLYTSGSTGKPKGVLHSTAGYMIYAATTFKYVFDYKPNDIYWCTADVGWITGHSYVLYGPLLNGVTSVMFEGTPFYPKESRFWAVVEKYKVNQFYTAPTAIRSLMKFGDSPVKKHNLDSLKVLATAGEPINPEAWLWYHNVVGNGKCPIVDTFWQTETGGPVITPLPGAVSLKPGSACFPFFGVTPVLLTEEGNVIEGPGEGYLVFSRPWPGLMRTVYDDHARYETTYFTKFPGYFLTGDGARRDKDGYLWITGRVDDMLNVSGHLLSSAQVESALMDHRNVVEGAAVAAHHELKGQVAYCFVTLRDGLEFSDELVAELKLKVREKIGAFAVPEFIQFAPALPKTRSGKIMRRLLRKIADGDSEFGDMSTLADETVIQLLLEHKLRI